MTTSIANNPVLALYIDCEIEKRVDALCLLNWFSKKPLEETGIQVLSLQSAGNTSKSVLRNQALGLNAAAFVAFIDPTIEINWPELAAAAEGLKHFSQTDCITVEEHRTNPPGPESIVQYGLGNPMQTTPAPGSRICRHPANPRCFWRANLVRDLKFDAANTEEEFSASEYAWSLKAAARTETALHLPLNLYRTNGTRDNKPPAT